MVDARIGCCLVQAKADCVAQVNSMPELSFTKAFFMRWSAFSCCHKTVLPFRRPRLCEYCRGRQDFVLLQLFAVTEISCVPTTAASPVNCTVTATMTAVIARMKETIVLHPAGMVNFAVSLMGSVSLIHGAAIPTRTVRVAPMKSTVLVTAPVVTISAQTNDVYHLLSFVMEFVIA